MAGILPTALFFVPAVHISDGPLAGPWLVGGFVVAGILALFGAWRLTEDEVPRVALLTAAFFVASSLHLPLGPGSVHLLLNGLVGVVLGRRSALAIPVGVFMQAVLLQHGGYSVIGVNSVIQVVPALMAWQLFAWLHRVPGICRPGPRACLVGVSVLCAALGLVFSADLLWEYHQTGATAESAAVNAWQFTIQPLVLLAAGLVVVALVWLEGRMKNAPEFPLGLLVGELTVLGTVALETVVLILGGDPTWPTWAFVILAAHVPVAMVEGVVLGFTVGYLARVKPEMLGWKAVEEPACPVDSLP
jgi:cobalt/nickel transport system permease protein